MAQTLTIFDRLRTMQTEGQSLHVLIAEACDVGNELVAALDTLADRRSPHPAHRRALAALARAYADHGDTPDNGARAA